VLSLTKLTSDFKILMDVKITIVDREGVSHLVDAPTDMAMNLMEVIRSYELAPEGTIGICGGMAMCASCQCYIQSVTPLPEKGDEEEAMLSEAFYVENNSRLSCQLPITENMEGLIIGIAPSEE
jgi:2Fe-2S ferredoxin